MLCFVFAALVVLLDQFFKHWVVRTLEVFEKADLIPGVIGLTHIQNTGAAFSILADQRWLLAGIAFVAAIVLIFILLRYTEGFWGTLGLAAVLGGAVGNLIDRVFYGHVVDMFRVLFINFAVFNIADIFITLGFVTFCLHFIAVTIRSSRNDKESDRRAQVGTAENYEMYNLPDVQDIPDYDDSAVTKIADSRYSVTANANTPVYSAKEAVSEYYESKPEPEHDITSTLEALSVLESLESELDSIDDLDVDKLLREYGFEENDNN